MANTISAKIRRGVEERLGEGTDARTGALHLAGDYQKVGHILREPVNRGIITTSPGPRAFISFQRFGRSVVAPVIFSRKIAIQTVS